MPVDTMAVLTLAVLALAVLASRVRSCTSHCITHTLLFLTTYHIPLTTYHLLLKAGGALYYVEHLGADSGPARRALLRAVQPLWSLLGGGFQACRDTRAALGRQPGLRADVEQLEVRRHSLCAGLLPLICGVCRAVKPDAASERTARLQRRERARSPVRRRGHHWEVTSNRNVVIVVSR